LGGWVSLAWAPNGPPGSGSPLRDGLFLDLQEIADFFGTPSFLALGDARREPQTDHQRNFLLRLEKLSGQALSPTNPALA